MTNKQEKIAGVLNFATDGKVVGKTRLQKLFCLLNLAGEIEGFSFKYHHYGPYSEELDIEISLALFENPRLIEEETKRAQWGGRYSVFRLTAEGKEKVESAPILSGFGEKIVQICTGDNVAVAELELAATAAWVAHENEARSDFKAWSEVETLKRDKKDRIPQARKLYKKIQDADTKGALPTLVS